MALERSGHSVSPSNLSMPYFLYLKRGSTNTSQASCEERLVPWPPELEPQGTIPSLLPLLVGALIEPRWRATLALLRKHLHVNIAGEQEEGREKQSRGQRYWGTECRRQSCRQRCLYVPAADPEGGSCPRCWEAPGKGVEGDGSHPKGLTLRVGGRGPQPSLCCRPLSRPRRALGAKMGYVSAVWVQGRQQTETRVSISCWEACMPCTLRLAMALPVLILKGRVRNQGELTASQIIWEVAINSQASSECKIFERLYCFKNIE